MNTVIIIIGFAVIACCLGVSFLWSKRGAKTPANDDEQLERYTLSSTRNTEAQTTLAKLKYNKKPFDGEKTADFRMYNTFEGNEAGVYINGIKIGDIPADKKEDFIQNMHRITGIRDYDIVENKKTKILSCEITVGFKKASER